MKYSKTDVTLRFFDDLFYDTSYLDKTSDRRRMIRNKEKQEVH